MSVVTVERRYEPTFRDDLHTQARIIWALIFRELRTRFGKLKFGMVWTLTEPVCYAFMIITIREFMGRTAALGNSLEVFYLTGLLPYLFFRNLAGKGLTAISANESLVKVPIITNLDVLFARFILEIIIFTFATIVWLSVLAFRDLQYFPANPLTFMTGFAAVALLGIGVGTINGVIGPLVPWYGNLWPWLVRILFFTSGALYLIQDRFSPDLIAIFWWNPLLHCVEWLRSGFFEGFRSGLLDPSYLIFLSALFWLIGLMMERALRAKLRRNE